MAEVHRLADHRREFITDGERSELRATWHEEAGFVVISLWRDDTCVATSHLTPKEAGRLASFITGGLADLAQPGGASVTRVGLKPSWRSRAGKGLRTSRQRVAWSLEGIARRLR